MNEVNVWSLWKMVIDVDEPYSARRQQHVGTQAEMTDMRLRGGKVRSGRGDGSYRP